MTENKVTITINITDQIDPTKLGIAIAQLIKAITPEEELPEMAESLKAQISQHLASENIQRATIQYPDVTCTDDDTYFGSGGRG